MRPFEPRLLRRARSARLPLAASVAIGLAQSATVLAQAVLLSLVISDAVTAGASVADERGRLGLLVLVVAARAVLVWGSARAGRAAATAVRSELRGRLLDRIVGLGPVRLGTERTGQLALLAGRGLDALDGYFARYLPQLVLAALVPLVVVVVAAANDWASALILGVTIPLIPVFMVLVGLAARRGAERQWQALGALGAHLVDVLEGLPTLRVFGRARRQREVLGRLAGEHRTATMATLRVAFLSSLVLELIATLGTALVAVAVGLRLVDGSLDLRTALLVLLLAPEAYLPLRNVGSSFHASIEGATAARQALDLLDEAAVPPGPAPAPPAPAHGRPDVFPLRLEGVTFRWPDRARPVLAGVDLTLGPGEHVAVVGESGAGKSTLLGLLLGFVAPDRGRITAAGVAIEAIGLDRWRTQVSWVPQRPHLFAASIADNIRLGRRDASDDAVRAAAERANALGFIERLPDGVHTPIGDGGVPLSGGEVQRIALARAFLRDAPLVLLDEPTASLDAGNQDVIVEALEGLLEGRAAIVVTHRAAPVRLAGRVLTLQGGRLIERPTRPTRPTLVPSPVLR